ncbi:nitroreductase family protein [Arcanobacterium hippocoleae]
MNHTIETILAHRSIRKFAAESIPHADLQAILDAAMRTPTSRFCIMLV